MDENPPTIWSALNPSWMFCCRPNDFHGYRHTLCPGIGWLPGIIGLLIIHVTCFSAFISHWWWYGYRSHHWWLLTPIFVLWLWFGAADITFRCQRPTPQERAGFDNAVINWFGMVLTVTFYWWGLPAVLGLLLWWSW